MIIEGIGLEIHVSDAGGPVDDTLRLDLAEALFGDGVLLQLRPGALVRLRVSTVLPPDPLEETELPVPDPGSG